ncbi:MAG TPA: YfbU family protein [Rhodoferax sp.]|nr:YfbU family protein [Rhodoferax sp.]
MNPKSERFEMRVDEEVLASVDAWRSEQGDLPSRAEAIRRLVELGLSRDASKSVQFSDGEKLLLIMLGDVLKHLKVKDGEVDPKFIAEVIYGGHYWAPKWELSGLYHNHVDEPAHVRLVVDVLDMWRFVETGYKKLSKTDKDRVAAEVGVKGASPVFTGFDGNNEAEYMSIATFFVDKMGRFSEFKGREMNSHCPMVDRYQGMLRVFEPMRVGLVGVGLSADQIVRILLARE